MADLVKVNDLEEQFFLKENEKLKEKYRAMRELKETKEALAAASGITDDLVLEKFIALGIRPETIASISLVPLVEVAWADGTIDPKEKDAILQTIGKFGWTPDSANYVVLNQWLEQKPPASMLTAWKHYVETICHKMTDDEVAQFKKEIMDHAVAVAEAAGGFLGFGKISAEERNMITQMENAFCNK